MQLNCSVNQITNAGGIFYINCLFMPIPTRLSLFSAKISTRESRGRSSRRWNRFCVHARVHASALSRIVHRIGVSAFQNSNARSAQVGFLVLDIAATAIVRYRPTHLHLLSKRLRTNGDYIIHVSSYDPLMCLRRYLDPHVVGSDSSEHSRDFRRELWIIINGLIFREIDILYRTWNS